MKARFSNEARKLTENSISEFVKVAKKVKNSKPFKYKNITISKVSGYDPNKFSKYNPENAPGYKPNRVPA